MKIQLEDERIVMTAEGSGDRGMIARLRKMADDGELAIDLIEEYRPYVTVGVRALGPRVELSTKA